MILYHGTNEPFESIDLSRSKPNKDFGRGFYLSADKEQAMEMAKTKVDQMESGIPTVMAYEVDEEDNPSLSMDQDLLLVINSDTYQRILNDNTRLYYQSPRYVYSFLDNELKTGKN